MHLVILCIDIIFQKNIGTVKVFLKTFLSFLNTFFFLIHLYGNKYNFNFQSKVNQF